MIAPDKIYYRKGFKYQLVVTYRIQTLLWPDKDIETEFISLTRSGLLTVRKGYAWDGCSGPAVDDNTNMRGGLVHDALCQLGRLGLLDQKWFDAVNEEFVAICKEDGMNAFRRWYYFRGVEDFARFAFQAGNEPYPVFTAP